MPHHVLLSSADNPAPMDGRYYFGLLLAMNSVMIAYFRPQNHRNFCLYISNIHKNPRNIFPIPLLSPQP
uniref:Uncharacterized protein n=1 Tax=Arundo donax TaxID=35708 RepID=A0A0A9ECT2_ARUDO